MGLAPVLGRGLLWRGSHLFIPISPFPCMCPTPATDLQAPSFTSAPNCAPVSTSCGAAEGLGCAKDGSSLLLAWRSARLSSGSKALYSRADSPLLMSRLCVRINISCRGV